MNMEKEMMYVAPTVEVLEMEIEKGYEISIPGTGPGEDL